ncbi:MAG: hypothetical protein JW862_12940 [Anaerolineales bacterium]|nr:hypothetical protein [Anaerolineales bacterium]
MIGVVAILSCAAVTLITLYYLDDHQETEQSLIAELTAQASDHADRSTQQAELAQTRQAEASSTLTAVSDELASAMSELTTVSSELTALQSTLLAVHATQTSMAQTPMVIITEAPTAAPPQATPRPPTTAFPGADFEDISLTGTWLAISDQDDELSSAIPLDFSFSFYGETYEFVYASTNGFLTFLRNQDDGCCSGDQLPDDDPPDGLIAGFWTDLSPSQGGDVYYQTIGSAPGRRFILQYQDICDYEGCDQRITFQIKLFEGSNVIEIHHLNNSFVTGTNDDISIGIENPLANRGVQYLFWNSTDFINLDTPSAAAFAPPYNGATPIQPLGGRPVLPTATVVFGDEFEDIRATGQLADISETDDAVSSALPIGFTFDYDGQAFSSVYASSNGFMTFLSDQGHGCCSGDPIPSAEDPNGVVAAFWTDLSPGLGGEVYYQTLGDAPQRRFVLQFDNVCDLEGCDQRITFQIKLFENNGTIEIHYAENSFVDGSGDDISIGIENLDGTRGAQSYFWFSGDNVDLQMPLKLVFEPPFFDAEN